MRNFTLLLLLAFSLLSTPAFSQNKAFPNAIHAKLNAVDYGLLFDNNLKVGQAFEFAYFRNIAPALNVGVPLKLGLAKLPGSTENTVFSSFDLMFRLENMKPENKLVPFAFAGAGYILEDFKNGHAQFPFGAGVHFRLSDYAFISLQAEFRKALVDDRDNIQLGLGYVYLLHKSETPPTPTVTSMNDDDFDGIANDVDKCPNEPGPPATLGCPDTDNDGVADVDDLCPEEAGALATGGCPDFDNDGIPDIDDDCPTESGTLRGCPDKDFDGVADKDDRCPDEAGLIDNEGCPLAKDTDGDGFDDEKDLCPNEPGTVRGCPDTDGDGVADKNDKCPRIAGPISNDGCPESNDTDNDGFADDVDECPNTAGSVKGCPDTDGDGIADKNDKCPEKAGPTSNNGCPEILDADNDGFADNVDECPNAAGTVKGCPDTDGDGIADKNDKCPQEAGPASNDGCPEILDADSDGFADNVDECPNVAGTLKGCPDTDGDGIADKNDKCPQQKGPASNNGCPEVTSDPDSDGDGVADSVDKCPNTPGLASNFGCPEVKKEVKDRLEYAAKAVKFETAKAILKSESYSILDEMIAIMRDNPDYILAISGHTDNVGDDEDNFKLSQERAKACYDYLIFRGIKAERLRHAGFGESRPISTNDTSMGREMNRRVEFELMLN